MQTPQTSSITFSGMFGVKKSGTQVAERNIQVNKSRITMALRQVKSTECYATYSHHRMCRLIPTL